MAENNQSKPQENPASEPQSEPNKPTIIIPQKPRPDLNDYQTEGYKPEIEKK